MQQPRQQPQQPRRQPQHPQLQQQQHFLQPRLHLVPSEPRAAQLPAPPASASAYLDHRSSAPPRLLLPEPPQGARLRAHVEAEADAAGGASDACRVWRQMARCSALSATAASGVGCCFVETLGPMGVAFDSDGISSDTDRPGSKQVRSCSTDPRARTPRARALPDPPSGEDKWTPLPPQPGIIAVAACSDRGSAGSTTSVAFGEAAGDDDGSDDDGGGSASGAESETPMPPPLPRTPLPTKQPPAPLGNGSGVGFSPDHSAPLLHGSAEFGSPCDQRRPSQRQSLRESPQFVPQRQRASDAGSEETDNPYDQQRPSQRQSLRESPQLVPQQQCASVIGSEEADGPYDPGRASQRQSLRESPQLVPQRQCASNVGSEDADVQCDQRRPSQRQSLTGSPQHMPHQQCPSTLGSNVIKVPCEQRRPSQRQVLTGSPQHVPQQQCASDVGSEGAGCPDGQRRPSQRQSHTGSPQLVPPRQCASNAESEGADNPCDQRRPSQRQSLRESPQLVPQQQSAPEFGSEEADGPCDQRRPSQRQSLRESPQLVPQRQRASDAGTEEADNPCEQQRPSQRQSLRQSPQHMPQQQCALVVGSEGADGPSDQRRPSQRQSLRESPQVVLQRHSASEFGSEEADNLYDQQRPSQGQSLNESPQHMPHQQCALVVGSKVADGPYDQRRPSQRQSLRESPQLVPQRQCASDVGFEEADEPCDQQRPSWRQSLKESPQHVPHQQCPSDLGSNVMNVPFDQRRPSQRQSLRESPQLVPQQQCASDVRSEGADGPDGQRRPSQRQSLTGSPQLVPPWQCASNAGCEGADGPDGQRRPSQRQSLTGSPQLVPPRQCASNVESEGADGPYDQRRPSQRQCLTGSPQHVPQRQCASDGESEEADGPYDQRHPSQRQSLRDVAQQRQCPSNFGSGDQRRPSQRLSLRESPQQLPQRQCASDLGSEETDGPCDRRRPSQRLSLREPHYDLPQLQCVPDATVAEFSGPCDQPLPSQRQGMRETPQHVPQRQCASEFGSEEADRPCEQRRPSHRQSLIASFDAVAPSQQCPSDVGSNLINVPCDQPRPSQRQSLQDAQHVAPQVQCQLDDGSEETDGCFLHRRESPHHVVRQRQCPSQIGFDEPDGPGDLRRPSQQQSLSNPFGQLVPQRHPMNAVLDGVRDRARPHANELQNQHLDSDYVTAQSQLEREMATPARMSDGDFNRRSSCQLDEHGCAQASSHLVHGRGCQSFAQVERPDEHRSSQTQLAQVAPPVFVDTHQHEGERRQSLVHGQDECLERCALNSPTSEPLPRSSIDGACRLQNTQRERHSMPQEMLQHNDQVMPEMAPMEPVALANRSQATQYRRQSLNSDAQRAMHASPVRNHHHRVAQRDDQHKSLPSSEDQWEQSQLQSFSRDAKQSPLRQSSQECRESVKPRTPSKLPEPPRDCPLDGTDSEEAEGEQRKRRHIPDTLDAHPRNSSCTTSQKFLERKTESVSSASGCDANRRRSADQLDEQGNAQTPPSLAALRRRSADHPDEQGNAQAPPSLAALPACAQDAHHLQPGQGRQVERNPGEHRMSQTQLAEALPPSYIDSRQQDFGCRHSLSQGKGDDGESCSSNSSRPALVPRTSDIGDCNLDKMTGRRQSVQRVAQHNDQVIPEMIPMEPVASPSRSQATQYRRESLNSDNSECEERPSAHALTSLQTSPVRSSHCHADAHDVEHHRASSSENQHDASQQSLQELTPPIYIRGHHEQSGSERQGSSNNSEQESETFLVFSPDERERLECDRRRSLSRDRTYRVASSQLSLIDPPPQPTGSTCCRSPNHHQRHSLGPRASQSSEPRAAQVSTAHSLPATDSDGSSQSNSERGRSASCRKNSRTMSTAAPEVAGKTRHSVPEPCNASRTAGQCSKYLADSCINRPGEEELQRSAQTYTPSKAPTRRSSAQGAPVQLPSPPLLVGSSPSPVPTESAEPRPAAAAIAASTAAAAALEPVAPQASAALASRDPTAVQATCAAAAEEPVATSRGSSLAPAPRTTAATPWPWPACGAVPPQAARLEGESAKQAQRRSPSHPQAGRTASDDDVCVPSVSDVSGAGRPQRQRELPPPPIAVDLGRSDSEGYCEVLQPPRRSSGLVVSVDMRELERQSSIIVLPARAAVTAVSSDLPPQRRSSSRARRRSSSSAKALLSITSAEAKDAPGARSAAGGSKSSQTKGEGEPQGVVFQPQMGPTLLQQQFVGRRGSGGSSASAGSDRRSGADCRSMARAASATHVGSALPRAPPAAICDDDESERQSEPEVQGLAQRRQEFQRLLKDTGEAFVAADDLSAAVSVPRDREALKALAKEVEQLSAQQETARADLEQQLGEMERGWHAVSEDYDGLKKVNRRIRRLAAKLQASFAFERGAARRAASAAPGAASSPESVQTSSGSSRLGSRSARLPRGQSQPRLRR